MIIVRIDLNSPNGIPGGPRFQRHAPSILNLAELDDQVVLLSHQGRKGNADFVSLRNHSEFLSRILDMEVKFLERPFPPSEPGIFLLENTRFFPGEEEKTRPPWVLDLAEKAWAFFLDALSVAHRPHASVIGFKGLLPCFPGPLLLQEMETLKSFRPRAFVIGGAKPETLELLTRLPGEVFVGGGLLEKDLPNNVHPLPPIKANRRIVDVDPKKSVEILEEFQGEPVVLAGPLGLWERGFQEGTRAVFQLLGPSALAGGGSTLEILKEMGLKPAEQVSAGKAMLYFYAGKRLPGLEIFGKGLQHL